jgi:hypothetical protein
MIKNISKIEIAIGERIYHFLCEVDAPIGEVHDVLMQMKGLVIQKMNEAHDAMKGKEADKPASQVEDKPNAV